MNTHKIETLQDIIKCTNENNLDNFLKDFRVFLQMANSFKKIDGLQGELSRRSVDQFIWIDDGENNYEIKLTIK